MVSTSICHINAIPGEKAVGHCGGTDLQHRWFRNNRILGMAQEQFRVAEVK